MIFGSTHAVQLALFYLHCYSSGAAAFADPAQQLIQALQIGKGRFLQEQDDLLGLFPSAFQPTSFVAIPSAFQTTSFVAIPNNGNQCVSASNQDCCQLD